jgi:hypothetical protein
VLDAGASMYRELLAVGADRVAACVQQAPAFFMSAPRGWPYRVPASPAAWRGAQAIVGDGAVFGVR